MTFYLCILFVLVVLITYVDSNLRCYSCSPCNELEIYAGDVTHFEQDCYLDRYCMKVRRILQYLKSFRKILEITLVYIIYLLCKYTLDFRHYWRHFWVKTRSIISRMPVDFNLYSIRRRLHWNITGRYYNIKNFFSKKFFKKIFFSCWIGTCSRCGVFLSRTFMQWSNFNICTNFNVVFNSIYIIVFSNFVKYSTEK